MQSIAMTTDDLEDRKISAAGIHGFFILSGRMKSEQVAELTQTFRYGLPKQSFWIYADLRLADRAQVRF